MSAGPALFCCFGLLYALTWNGRYLHDGPLFLQDLQDGTWLHVHVAYLPFAHLLKLALTWLPGTGGPEALAVLAILSGASMVALSYSLCARLTGDWIAGLSVGLLVGVAPVVWSASGMVEIHIFAGAGACAAAWLAYRPRGSPALRSALATLLALCFHLSNILIVPLLIALANSIGRKRSMVKELAITVAGTGAVVLVMRSVGHALPPKVESLTGVFPGLVDLLSGFWKYPAVLGDRLLDEYVQPWLLLCLGPAFALLPGGRVPFWIRAVSAALGIAGAGLVAIYIPLAGQYGLVLCPVLAIGTAQAASALRPGVGRAVLLGLLVAVSALAAVPERERLIADPDREWAIEVSPFLGPGDVVLCLGMSRKMRIRQFTEATAVDFMPSGDSGSAGAEGATESAVRKLTQEGQRLYLDPLVLSKGPQFPTLEPIVAAIRQVLVLEDVEEAPLVRARLATDR